MPLSLVTGPANAGKAQVVLEALRAHVARGQHDPLLVLPTDADRARYRRELADEGPVLGVRVERFQGLLGEMLRRSQLEEAALGSLARRQLLGSLAREHLTGSSLAPQRPAGSLAREYLPGSLAPRHLGEAPPAAVPPGLVTALLELVAELEVARVAPKRLREALAAGEMPSLGGVGDVFEGYHRELVRMKRADPELRATRALDELRRKPALWGSTPVLLYGFDSFTPLQLDAIETLAGAVDAPVTLSLAYEPGRRAFAARASTFQRLLPLASTHVELPPRREHYAPRSRGALHHLERSLLEEGPRRVPSGFAVRLLEGGTPRAELELVASEVSELLRSGVSPEQIAIVHRSPQTVGDLLGEVLESHGVPCSLRSSARFSHTAVGGGLLGLARCALCEGELGDLLAWLRTPGVLSHPRLADRLEAQARRRGLTRAEQARALWEQENWPLDRIDRLQQAAQRRPTALIDALGAELQRLFLAPRRASGELLAQEERSEAHALAGGRRALEELRELARLAPERAPTALELIGALEQLELPDGSLPPPGAVALLDPLSLRARRVRALFLCGMQEGVFPAPAHPHPLLSPEQRRELALRAGLVLPDESSEALQRERFLLYALCSRPEEILTLSWHTAEEDGSPAARSLFVEDVCDLFDERLFEEIKRGPAGSLGGPAAPPGDGQATGEHDDSTAEIVVRRLTEGEGAIVVDDGSIEPLRDERVLAELREQTQWSASSLECFNACPVRWFVERLLHPQPLDPDSEPLARGGVAHAALKQTLERLCERTGSGRIAPASLEEAKRLLGEALREHSSQRPLSVVPERVPGALRRLQSELERYLEWAAESDSPLEPAHLELEFDALELGEGVSVRGRIDRIDVSPHGDAVVYDYKARNAPPAARWVSEGALQVALYMRATERLLQRPVVGGFYQPLAGRDLRPRGVLDADAPVELDCVRTDRREPGELQELLEQCESVASSAVARARDGAIEPRPSSCSPRGGCMYPTICRSQP